MSENISVEHRLSCRCAVFKIDLKGRFVYIDDETEELLGFPRDELFGRSIYEFISNDSHQILDRVLARRNRYESFYESLPLRVRAADGELRQFETVISLNFIAGNPVNYQLILVPSRIEKISFVPNLEREFLRLIDRADELTDFNVVAEHFCRVGGYAEAECYLPDEAGRLGAVGSYTQRNYEHSAPYHLEQLFQEVSNPLHGIPEEPELHEDFGWKKDEVVLLLRYTEGRLLVLHFHRPADSCPSPEDLENLRLSAKTWHKIFKNDVGKGTLGEQLRLLSHIGDSLRAGIIVVDENSQLLLKNDWLDIILPSGQLTKNLDLGNFFDTLGLCRSTLEPALFHLSPYPESIRNRTFSVADYVVGSDNRVVRIFGAPVHLAGLEAYVLCFITDFQTVAKKEQLDKMSRKLVTSIAHDLSTPLISIEAFAKRLRDDYGSQLDEHGRVSLDCLIEDSQVLQSMMEGLGKMSRNWEVEQIPERVSVRTVVDDLVTFLKGTYPGIDYQITVDESLPELVIPKMILTQLFRHLLDNAFKYSSQSAIPAVTVGYQLSNDGHRFSISDNGPGINAQYHQKVFDPFFRVPETEPVAAQGGGLGLTIANDIITTWGGSIHIDNSGQSGTTVVFTIPLRIGEVKI